MQHGDRRTWALPAGRRYHVFLLSASCRPWRAMTPPRIGHFPLLTVEQRSEL